MDQRAVEGKNRQDLGPDCLDRVNTETAEDTSHAETIDLISECEHDIEAEGGPALVEEDRHAEHEEAGEVTDAGGAGKDDGGE